MNATLSNAAAGEVRIPKKAMFLRDAAEAVLELGKGSDPQNFTMVALTGKPLQHWWFGTLAIELSGVRMKKQLPVLKDHDPNQRLGFTTNVENVPGRGIVAEGKLMADSAASREVLNDAKQGFPWQASTYLQAQKILRVPPGQEAKCNGKPVQGPAVIFLESTLREVTFCALGVDDDTSATPLSGTVAGEDVAVLLSLPTAQDETMEATKLAEQADKGGAAATPPIDRTAVLAEGAAAERARVNAILTNSAEAQATLRDKLIADGTPVEAALMALNKDLRERLAAGSKLSVTATSPLANGNTADVAAKTSADAKLAAMPEGADKWKAEFAADAKLQDEFGGDVELYIGWKTNEQRAALKRGD